MGRKVITLGHEGLAEACTKLQAKIEAAGYVPDLIVGILTGGDIVADGMFTTARHAAVELHRPSTRAKRRLPRGLVAHLPYPVLNALRRVEAFWLGRRKPVPTDAPVELPCEVAHASSILVVDDACDSGVTLEAVMRALRAGAPEADIRSAVITVTTRTPLILPDYTLYDNLTLIRFPWSMDYKQR